MASKVSLYNHSELKATTDDAITNYINSLKFRQTFTLVNTRLFIGYSALILAATAFYWDYTYGFDATKGWTAIAVAIYTLLNGTLTFWVYYVEKNTFYQGVSPSGDNIAIASTVQKYDHRYHLRITTTSKDGAVATIELEAPFNKWFNEAGYFVAPPLQKHLTSSIPVIEKHCTATKS